MGVMCLIFRDDREADAVVSESASDLIVFDSTVIATVEEF